MALALYLLTLLALAVQAPAAVWSPGTGAFIFVLGWIGVWRWSWGALHLCRSLWYRRLVFPRWRAQADRLGDEATAGELVAGEVFLVITSYRIPAETSIAVFTAAIAEAVRYPSPVTLVAAVVEMADQRLLANLPANTVDDLITAYANEVSKLAGWRLPQTGVGFLFQ